MKILLILGPLNEKRISMTNYADYCKNIYQSKGLEVEIFRLKIINSKNTIVRAFSRYFLVPFQMIHKKADIFHLIDHSYGHSLIFTKSTCFSTIHDLIPLEIKKKESYIKSSISRLFFYFIISITLKKSSKIFVASKSTINLLDKFFNKPRNLILAYNPPINKKLPNLDCSVKDIDILLIGSNFYKNNNFAFNTCLKIKQKLSITWINPNMSLVRNIGKTNHKINTLTNISDHELYKIYSRAKVILNLSLSEGFGWMPFEASFFDCCSLMSDINIFREIHPSSLIYLQSLKNVSKLIDSISKLLTKDSFRSILLDNIRKDYKILNRSENSLKKELCEVLINENY